MNENRFRLTLPLAVIAGVIILLIAGAAVAFALPLVSVTPDRTIAQMLPASTALYISADLNPSGATKSNLDAIEHDFTDQPGWAQIAKTFNSTMHGTQQRDACYNQTQGQVQGHLGDLGHASAFALIDTTGLSASAPGNAATAAKRDFVFLASLDVHMTLVQALGGFHLTLQQTSTEYHGTTIYQESFPACGQMSSSVPKTVYAALVDGYVVLGLLPDPIERIVDTAAGTVPSLTTVQSYTTLMAQLPADQLGGYYLDGSALKNLGLLNVLHQGIKNVRISSSSTQGVQKPSAAALTVETDGFRLSAAGYSPSGAPKPQTPAGQLAAQLPSDTLALVSLQNVASVASKLETEFKQAHVLTGSTAPSVNAILADITADLSGEADAVLLHPAGTMSFTGTNGKVVVPVSLLWQVKDDASAMTHLHDLAVRAKIAGQLTQATAPDGTTYFVTKDGYGYAVRKGWAIASLAIAQQIGALSSTPTLASNPAYRKTTLSNATTSALWYVDLHNLRLQLEAALLPRVAGTSSDQQYKQYVKPFLAPLQSFSASAGITTDGKLGVSTMFLGISNNTGS